MHLASPPRLPALTRATELGSAPAARRAPRSDPPPRKTIRMPRLIERLLIVVASLAVAIGVIALLSGGLLAGRDSPGVSGAASGPGVAFPDQGSATLRPGQARPRYDSAPPTRAGSGFARTARS